MSEEPATWTLLMLCIAGTYLWRGLGVFVSTRIDPAGAVFQWITCISYAMLAGLISRMTILPLGALAETSLWERLVAMGLAFVVFFLCRRNILLGVLTGVLMLVLLIESREWISALAA